MTANSHHTDFGAHLRLAREKRGLSLHAIADATKISVRALEALERNDISRLPGGIFSRAFVREYAAQVGLDPEQTLGDFMSAFPHESVTQGHPRTREKAILEELEADSRRSPWPLGWVALAGVLAVVLLAFALLAFYRSREKATTPAESAVTLRSASPTVTDRAAYTV